VTTVPRSSTISPPVISIAIAAASRRTAVSEAIVLETHPASAVEHSIESRTERKDEAFSSADLARLSLGDLSEDEVEGIRTGAIENPAISQVVALAEAFGVHPFYFLETGKKPALLGEQEISALGDPRARVILNKSLSLSDREKDMVLDMIQHLG
jgi:hypothetical protein